MLRRKLILINLIFALVMLAIILAGVFLLLRSIDRSDVNAVDIEELEQVKALMVSINAETVNLDAATDKKLIVLREGLPESYHLVVIDEDGEVIAHTGIDKITLSAISMRAPRQPNGVYGTVYNGIVIVSKTFGTTTLHAVDSTESTLADLNRYLTIYLSVVMAVLLIIFVGSAVVEMQAIFPRLNRLKLAMDEVYNGNYEQTLKIKPGKRRDEITALLVDFDMLRRKLRDATMAKEAADRERGIVVSGISHDLRTPLTVIKSHAKGLLDGVAKRVGKEDEYIKNIYSTALEMENLVAKLADFTKVEKQEITYSFVVRDLADLIQTFVDKHYIAYAARGLNLKCKLPKNKKLWVSVDKDQFNRVWQNLCDNSLKYKNKEEAHVLITADLVEDDVVVRVMDDGPGIASYEVEYIFESYYRGDASRTHPTDGSGLGLSIVKNCVIAHNGTIQAYNNNGLTIEITLPYRRKK